MTGIPLSSLCIVIGLTSTFINVVPIGEVCDRVSSAYMLLKLASLEGLATKAPPNILFYVNIFDIDRIKKMKSYIACTTEKIFAEKKDLYDVYIDNQDVRLSIELKDILKQTRGDELKSEKFKASVDTGLKMDFESIIKEEEEEKATPEISSPTQSRPKSVFIGIPTSRLSGKVDGLHDTISVSALPEEYVAPLLC